MIYLILFFTISNDKYQKERIQIRRTVFYFTHNTEKTFLQIFFF
jgi:hypothetical protein